MRSVVGIGVAAAFLLGAGCRPARVPGRPSPERLAPRPLAPSLEAGLERILKTPLLAGNDVRLVENGAVFDAIEAAIRQARHSVHIVTYIWRGEDGPSARLGAALLARRAGVACRLVVDSFGSVKFSVELERRLEATGCRIHRDSILEKGRLLARTHRKIVVVDGRVGITGGFGVGSSWLGNGRRKNEWRDSAVRVEGPTVAQMQRSFEQSWRDAGGDPLPRDVYPDLRAAGKIRAAFVSSSPRRGTPSAAELMTHLLASAPRRKLLIANSYFIPSDGLRERLIERRRAGVDVRVLMPGPVHDVPPVRAGQRDTYESLLAGGVRLYEYQPTMMHAKTVVVDGRWVVVGSTNMDAMSFERLEEGSLVADSPALAAELRRNFEADLTYAKEITAAEWAKRERLPEVARDIVGFFSDWL